MATKKKEPGSPVKVVPIDQVFEDPANARRHNEKNLNAIEGSLRQFGQVEPLVVQKSTGKVIGGNGRLSKMKDLGWTHVQIAEVDVNDVQAAALAITLNRTGELAEWDFETLAKQVEALQKEHFDLSSLGWLDHELEPMLQADWTPPDVQPFDPIEEGDPQPLIITADQKASILQCVAVWRERTGDYGSMDGEIIEAICQAWAKQNSRGPKAPAAALQD